MGIKMNHLSHRQMSESFLTAAFLSISGGLQDAYTYLFRGKVFANAQTGNIVLLSACVVDRNWYQAAHYLIPLLFFALGIAAAEWVRLKYQRIERLHWRQLVVLSEIILLFAVGFFPVRLNLFANALVSKPIHLRQHHIEHHQIEILFLDVLQSLFPIIRRSDLHAVLLQGKFNSLYDELFIIHH